MNKELAQRELKPLIILFSQQVVLSSLQKTIYYMWSTEYKLEDAKNYKRA